MKAYILLVILLSIYTVSGSLQDSYGDTIRSISKKSQNKYHWPRTEYSCQTLANNEIAIAYGWFWNGQICESCQHPYCICDKNNNCSGCVEGFKLIGSNSSSATWNTCIRCPNISKVGGRIIDDTKSYLYDKNIHRGFNEQQNLEDPEVVECETFQKLTQNNDFKTGQNKQKWEKALRSTQCATNKVDGIQFQHYGSICWYIIGCQEYTKYGKCQTCQAGYYKTKDQLCTKCMVNASDYNNYNKNTIEAVCDICNSQGQCTQCSPGYFLVAPHLYQNKDKVTKYDNEGFKRTENNNTGNSRSLDVDSVLDDPSWCAPCDEGCICSEPYMSPQGDLRFKLAAKPGYAINQNNEQCQKCSEVEGKKDAYCTECINIGLESFQCTQCQEYVYKASSGNLFDIRYTLLVNKKCYLCPENCKECFTNKTGEISESDISCKENFCFNGYREQKDSKGIIKCIKCDSANGVARCKTSGANQEEVPTQCITFTPGSTESGLYDQTPLVLTDIVQSKSISLDPHPKMIFTTYGTTTNINTQYHLVQNKEKKPVCVKGLNHCYLVDENNNQICKKCKNGYEIIDGICKVITTKTNCGTSEKDRNKNFPDCNSCVAGYRLQGEYCQKCNIQNCGNCSDNVNDCQKCQDGFRVWKKDNTDSNLNVVCETCEYGCKTCEADRKICTECLDTNDLYLHAGVCHKKTTNCAEFDRNTNKCTVCDYGHRMTLQGEDRFCVQCFSHEIGVIHCPTTCQDARCHYSTVNNDNLEGDDQQQSEGDEVEEQTEGEVDEDQEAQQ